MVSLAAPRPAVDYPLAGNVWKSRRVSCSLACIDLAASSLLLFAHETCPLPPSNRLQVEKSEKERVVTWISSHFNLDFSTRLDHSNPLSLPQPNPQRLRRLRSRNCHCYLVQPPPVCYTKPPQVSS